jgi:hypothetical protein
LMTVQEMDKNKKTIFWLHFALIVPFLSYIGIKGNKAHPRAYDLLLALTAFTEFAFSRQHMLNCVKTMVSVRVPCFPCLISSPASAKA